MGVIERADGVAQGMDGAEPLLEGDRPHAGRRHHVTPGRKVPAVAIGHRQPFLDQAHGLQGDAVGHGMETGRRERLEAVGERVHPRRRRDPGRKRKGQRRIGDDDARHHLRVEDDLLGPGLLAKQHRGAPGLRPRSRRRRHRHHRGQALRIGAGPVIADILEVPGRAVLGDHEGHRLAGVNPAAAAKGDDAVMAARAVGVDAGGDVAARRVGLDVREDANAEARGFTNLHRVGDHGKGGEAGIGDEQGALHAKGLARLGQFGDPSGAEAELGRIGPIARESGVAVGHGVRSPLPVRYAARGRCASGTTWGGSGARKRWMRGHSRVPNP